MISTPALVSGPTFESLGSVDRSATVASGLELGERLSRLRGLEIKYIDNAQFGAGAFSEGISPEVQSFVAEVEEGIGRPQAMGSGLPAHLARLCETPLLAAEQERELFRRMNFCKSKAASLQTGLRRSAKKAEAIEDHVSRAENIRNYLVQANTRLVMSIARGFADSRNSFDDLLSQGIASLMHAVEKFDFDRGYRFSTYATCAVRRDLYRMVMGTKKDGQRFSTGADEMLTGCTDHRAEAEGITESAWKSLSHSLNEMLDQLDDRERLIMAARFGLGDEKGKASYSRLGERLGISKERVRQLANRALDKLRELAPEHRLESMLA